MNENEAELLGAHVGDGTLYLAGKTVVWELRGSVEEKEYYTHIQEVIRSALHVEMTPKYRGPNSYGIQTTNKIITGFFTKSGFFPGKKVYTVTVPKIVKEENGLIQKAFIRGLFDTDGCLRFEKNRTPKNYYPRIEFSFASEEFTKDIFEMLTSLGFKSYRWSSRRQNAVHYSLGLAGFSNLEK